MALRLLARFAVFAAVIVVTTPVVVVGAGVLGRPGRMGTAYDKRTRLGDAEGRRLILVGGSSLQYGVDSPRLEERLGLSVVNLGIQASIGLGYGIRQAVSQTREGDVVLVVAEAAVLSSMDPNGESALYSLVGVYPEARHYLTREQWLQFPKYAWQSAFANVRSGEGALVFGLLGRRPFREQTNRWGDYIGHEGNPRHYSGASEEPGPPPQ